jgi:hypothetical protein
MPRPAKFRSGKGGERHAPRGTPKSGREKLLRAGLAGLFLVAGYASVTHALGYTMRTVDIDAAQRVSPRDGRLLALLSEKRSAATASATERRESQWLARQALLAEPLSVPAVATLGINAAIANRPETASILAHSDRLSRRDLRTRLWMIEDAAAREDTKGTLRHYDLALRTSRAAPELLFPVLARAIEDTEIRRELVPMLAAKPAWGESFIADLLGRDGDPRAMVALFQSLRNAGAPVSDNANARIVDRLLNAAYLDEAWRYYAAVRPNVDRRRSRDPDFALSGPPTPLDWTIVPGDPALAGSIQNGQSNGVFDFAAPPNIGGIVLQQGQLLPAGTYRIDGTSLNLQQARTSLPYWALSCADGRELGRVEMNNSDTNQGRFSGRFVVPSDCPLQFLRLVLRPTGDIAGISGQVDRVELGPAT